MEKAILSLDNLNISQKMNGTYSHNGDLAIDICSFKSLKAPFTGTIKRIYPNVNGVWLESKNKVEYADGTKDYMTVMTLHDNDVSNLKVGQTIKQGTSYIEPGTKGNVTGAHIHLAVGKGKFKGNGWYKGKYQPKAKDYAWLIYNQYDVTKALFLDQNVKMSNPIYNWKKIDSKGNLTSSSKKIEDVAKEVIQGLWGNGLTRKNKLTKAGYDYDAVQKQVNALLIAEKSKTKTIYIVQKGDYLIKIGKKFNVNWKQIAKDNNIKTPYIIKTGQKLIINKN